MADLLSPVAALLATLYGAALAGHLSAIALRTWLRRRRSSSRGNSTSTRFLSAREAAACALLAPLSVLALPLAPLLSPLHTAGYFSRLHDLWHGWERALHTTPAVHGALHVIYFLLLGLALVSLCRAVYTLARIRELSAVLQRAHAESQQQPEPAAENKDLVPPVYHLPTEQPLCFAAGVLRPRIYISKGLLRQLSSRDKDVVLAHEAAHVRRRDGWVSALITGFYALLPLPGSRLLYREWQQAAERACDAEAAQRVGDPCDVAAALVRVARLMLPPPTNDPSAPAYTGIAATHFAAAADTAAEDVSGRVQALLALSDTRAAASEQQQRCNQRGLLSLLALLALDLLVLLLSETWIRHAAAFLVYH